MEDFITTVNVGENEYMSINISIGKKNGIIEKKKNNHKTKQKFKQMTNSYYLNTISKPVAKTNYHPLTLLVKILMMVAIYNYIVWFLRKYKHKDT